MGGRTSSASGPLVANFVGEFDGATGTLTIRPAPSDNPNALSVFIPYGDGNPDSTPDNTFELRTASYGSTGTGPHVCGGGTLQSFWGDINITSGFRNQTFGNVWAEITEISSAQNAGCNSDDPATSGLSAANGLWSYGTVGYQATVTKRWHFRYQNGDSFTFRGRIVADLGAPTAGSGPKFDWAPTYVVSPTRSFQDIGTTTHHFVWSGTTFTDTRSSITFTTSGSAQPATSGLTYPATKYAAFGNGSYYVEDVSGASSVDTSGDFTVCAKFKPGRHPTADGVNSKVLVAKGLPESSVPGTQGWALMQMHEVYCFHWRTILDTVGNTMSFYQPGGWANSAIVPTQPETWEYDYICGGRNTADPEVGGPGVVVGLHGRWRGFNQPVSGTITDSTLPLVIGAYDGGGSPARDAGVYELIFDSRPASLDVMNEIVSAAEGRKLPGASPGVATYLAPFSTGTEVLGADQTTRYTLPPFATVPFAADGSGLLPNGDVVEYTRPFTDDTTVTGFCVGAEVTDDAGWWDSAGSRTKVAGTIAQVPGGYLTFSPGWGVELDTGTSLGYAADSFASASSGYLTQGTTHRFTGCVGPAGPTGSIDVYIDGTVMASHGWTSGTYPTSVGASSSRLTIQGPIPNNSYLPLSGGKIRRVFACPTSVEANCR